MAKSIKHIILCLIFYSCASFNENPIYLNLTPDLHKKYQHRVIDNLVATGNYKLGSTDLDGDFKREIFVYANSQPTFYSQEVGGMKKKFETEGTKIPHGILDYLSLDLDVDDKEELIFAYKDRLELCKLIDNEITCANLLSFEACDSVFINGIDLELDQNLDIFLSCNRGEATENYLFNQVEGTYKNIAIEAKVPVSFPTKYAYFADLDKDSLQDLILLGNDASFKIFRNLGNAEFKEVVFKFKPFFLGSLSLMDLDSDQDLDMVISIEPGVEAKEKWLVLINQGNFQFENKVDHYFLHGAMSGEQVIGTDLDLDGHQDIIPSFDQYKFIEEQDFSYLLRQRELKGKKIFSFEKLIETPEAANGKFILLDLENSGRMGLVGINSKNQLWQLTSLDKPNFTSVKIVPSVKNLGTKLVLQTSTKKSYLYEFRLKDGASSANTTTYSFGLTSHEQPLYYTLYYAGKKEKKVSNIPMGKPILLKE